MHIDQLVSALRAPGTRAELGRADTAVAAMAAAHAEAAAGVVALPVRRSSRPAVVAAGATVGAVVLALGVGSAAAAFSGALPEGLQRAAHQILGAPDYVAPTFAGSDDAEGSDSGSADPVGPAVTIDAAALPGLCQAYADVAPGDPQATSVPYQALASAAAAADQDVSTYCEPVLASASPSRKPTDPGKPTAKPSRPAKPTQASSKPADITRPTDAGAASSNAVGPASIGR